MAPLQPGLMYHIYTRGNNRENLFREARNYEYFLRLYQHHIDPVAETLAYCLLKNHLHLLVCVRVDPPKSPSRAFANLFNAYAKAINKAYGRSGALFQRPFRRKEVLTDRYVLRLLEYIHQNPVRHGFVQDHHHWPYSSGCLLSSDQQPVEHTRSFAVTIAVERLG